jgi:hypothetical protein
VLPWGAMMHHRAAPVAPLLRPALRRRPIHYRPQGRPSRCQAAMKAVQTMQSTTT